MATTLLRVHLQIARQEFARDEGRIITGVVLMMIGALLVAAVIVLLQVLGIAILQAHGLGFAWAVLAVVILDSGLGALLLFLGKRALRQPLMAETRALVRRTLRALMSP